METNQKLNFEQQRDTSCGEKIIAIIKYFYKNFGIIPHPNVLKKRIKREGGCDLELLKALLRADMYKKFCKSLGISDSFYQPC